MAVEASYKLGLRIAKAGKSYTILESLLLPAGKDVVNSVLRERAAKQCEVVTLSKDTISRQISGIASNIKEKLMKKVKASNIIAFNCMKLLILATWPIFLHL
jgi:hypothetical protein